MKLSAGQTEMMKTVLISVNASDMQVSTILSYLNGEISINNAISTIQPLEKAIKPREASKLFGISTKALEYHARLGRIRRVMPKGAKRGFGYVASDIRSLLEGREAA